MEAAKQVTLGTGDSQILEIEVHRVSKKLARTSKGK